MIVYTTTPELAKALEDSGDAFVRAAAAARDARIDDLPTIENEYLEAHRRILRETVKSVRNTKQPQRGTWTRADGAGESVVAEEP